MRLLFTIILIFLAIESLPQVIIVDQAGGGDYLTIQQGIDASQNGDTVLVYPGTYYENINFSGKNIVLCSRYIYDQDVWYINHTIIDGNHQGSVVLIISGEDETTTLYGFTIQNGTGTDSIISARGTQGGGVFVKDSNPQIRDCIIRNNIATYSGGGIFLWNSIIFLSGTILYNNCSVMDGGGIQLAKGASINFDTIRRCNIYLNYSARGCDIAKTEVCPLSEVIVDTFTVIAPDHFYISSIDPYGYQLHDIVTDIQHGKIATIDTDLYVNPGGDNLNSGLSPDDPLQSLSYAMSKIVSDSLHPNTIHLADGTYSSSLTGEKFPLGWRSYITIEGESMENTILDGENEIFHFMGGRLEKDITFRNMTLARGFGNLYEQGNQSGSMYSYDDRNILFKNITVKECNSGITSGLEIGYADKIIMKNVNFIDNYGSVVLGVWDWPLIPKLHTFENVLIQGTTGGNTIEEGYGLGISIDGVTSSPYYLKCIFKNLVMVENHNSCPDMDAGAFGFVPTDGAWCILINSSIGNNTCENNYEACLGMGYSARLDLYNSIVYNPDLPLELVIYNPPPYDPCFMNAYNTLYRGKDDLFNIYGSFVMYWGDEILNEDPLWLGEGDYPYALSEGSPCINAGTPMYVPGMEPPYIIQQDSSYYLITPDWDTIILPSTDMAGHARITGGRIDMGAYEYPDTGVFIPVIKSRSEELTLQAYPNPFSDKTTVSFTSNLSCRAVLEIYTITGNKIATLMDSRIPPGKFDINWNGTANNGEKVKQGAYICRLVVDGKVSSEVKVVKGK